MERKLARTVSFAGSPVGLDLVSSALQLIVKLRFGQIIEGVKACVKLPQNKLGFAKARERLLLLSRFQDSSIPMRLDVPATATWILRFSVNRFWH